MSCPQCGEELKENARFCSGCGLSFASFNTPGKRAHDEAEAQADPLLGQVLDGKYLLSVFLDKGAMGSVYRAKRIHIGDEVAIKVLHRKWVIDEAMLERFRREARAAAQLRHPNIVSIIDLSEARGADASAYIVMELIEGESLRKLLRRERCFGPERAVSLMRDICAGVGAAHRKGIFHRDLKPDNVIVIAPDEDRERETVKVVDFGIAKLRDEAGVRTLTETGMVVGTPLYMSPEQCRGEALDARADVYSLGAMVYEMLAGTPPFAAETPTGLIARHLFDTVPPLPESSGATPALAAVVMRSLAKDRDERQHDATTFARELREALQTPAANLPAQFRPLQTKSTPQATESLDQQRVTEELRGRSHEVAPVLTIPMQAAPPAAFQFENYRAPRASKARRAPFVIGTLLVLLLFGGAIVWLSIRRKSESQPAANQEGVKPSGSTSPAIATTPATANLPRAVKNAFGMEMVLIPAGSFMMGSENGASDEKPAHRVTINYSFYMGKYEMTQAQWYTVMGNNPSGFRGCDLETLGQCPVERVSWDDAKEFLRKLNAQNDGYMYRLPSEAEWEYACRAGTTGDYAGDVDAMGWYKNNSGDKTRPVGQKQANGFGLYDMHGNVWEWCEDWYHENYSGAPVDGSAWESGGLTWRVVRGGSWFYIAANMRSAHRSRYDPGVRNNDLGLRIVAVSRSL
jgi:formylglycine-generating enzyme required for sulfatase activity/tRNA A-37 threonylcarbamoyl transferase component Bud32